MEKLLEELAGYLEVDSYSLGMALVELAKKWRKDHGYID